MAIGTFPQFFYGFDITADNQNLNFIEPVGSGGTGLELTAVLPVGSYTATEIATQLKVSLDAASTAPLVYTVTFDRVSRRLTISSTAIFELLANSGTQFGTSPWTLLGFDTTTDKTGASTYDTENGAGSSYIGQWPPQSYVAPGFRKSAIQPSINEAASGELEIIKFGDRSFTEFELLYITDKMVASKEFFNNPNGVQDALDFLEFAITRAPMEFMPDRLTPSNFFTVVLDKTQQSSNGTGFELSEEVGRQLPGYYKTGKLTFRIKE